MGLLAVIVSASAAQPLAGLIEVRPNGERTLFTTERLSRGDRVVARDAGAQGAGTCCIALRILGSRQARKNVSDELNGRRVRAYVLASSTTTDGAPFVDGTLVFRARERYSTTIEDALRDDPMGRALPEVCTSSEGAHLLGLADGKPQAHLYMHFGYAVEPTCREESLRKFD